MRRASSTAAPETPSYPKEKGMRKTLLAAMAVIALCAHVPSAPAQQRLLISTGAEKVGAGTKLSLTPITQSTG